MSTTTIGDIVRGDAEVFPPYLYEAYRSTIRRAPTCALVEVPLTLSELTGPGPMVSAVTPEDADLTRNAGTGGEAMGQRIIVTGRVLDASGAPVRNTLVEVWQANSAGRYIHRRDQWPAPLDPNFLGIGRCHTNDAGEYRFLTVMPGAYPWRNHPNAWRPAHIHFSLFGNSWASRLVTQMYFAGDPLLPLDPIFNSSPTERARAAMIAAYAHDVTEPEWALGWRWDIVLDGPDAVTFEPERGQTPRAKPEGSDPLAVSDSRDLHL
jgi:protocatechuate 3,4-dioxygenase beta subunit